MDNVGQSYELALHPLFVRYKIVYWTLYSIICELFTIFAHFWQKDSANYSLFQFLSICHFYWIFIAEKLLQKIYRSYSNLDVICYYSVYHSLINDPNAIYERATVYVKLACSRFQSSPTTCINLRINNCMRHRLGCLITVVRQVNEQSVFTEYLCRKMKEIEKKKFSLLDSRWVCYKSYVGSG